MLLLVHQILKVLGQFHSSDHQCFDLPFIMMVISGPAGLLSCLLESRKGHCALRSATRKKSCQVGFIQKPETFEDFSFDVVFIQKDREGNIPAPFTLDLKTKYTAVIVQHFLEDILCFQS